MATMVAVQSATMTLAVIVVVSSLQGCSEHHTPASPEIKSLPMSGEQLQGACPDDVARCQADSTCAAAWTCMDSARRCDDVDTCFSQAAKGANGLLQNLTACLHRICEDNSRTSNVPLLWGPADCFVKPTFSKPEIALHQNWKYGKAYNKWSKQNETLSLDAYLPPDQDQRVARPAVVLMHGGAFTGGDSTSDFIPDLAYALARRGYVVFSINYRLVPASASALHEFFGAEPAEVAQQDARAAVRFLRSQAKKWRIDDSRIVIGGDSAGAIAALYYGYFPDASEGSSGNPGYSSAINAVFSISGEMNVQAFCARIGQDLDPHDCAIPGPPITKDLTDLMGSGGIPLIELHGTADRIIPYINGAETVARANFTGIRNLLVTVEDGEHVPMADAVDESQPFLNTWLSFMSGALNLRDSECPSRPASLVV